jgi:hypothetical protein
MAIPLRRIQYEPHSRGALICRGVVDLRNVERLAQEFRARLAT